MLLQLTATEWRTLRRLHLTGGVAPWADIRPYSRRAIVAHVREVLLWLRLMEVDGEECQITERGRLAQEMGEVDISSKELRARPKRIDRLDEFAAVPS